jgi:hypothetical protein
MPEETPALRKTSSPAVSAVQSNEYASVVAMEERPPIRRVAENILYKQSRTGDKVRSSNLVVRFGTWNVRSLYRSCSLAAAVRGLARYKLFLVGVQEFRWD